MEHFAGFVSMAVSRATIPPPYIDQARSGLENFYRSPVLLTNPPHRPGPGQHRLDSVLPRAYPGPDPAKRGPGTFLLKFPSP